MEINGAGVIARGFIKFSTVHKNNTSLAQEGKARHCLRWEVR